MARDVHMPAAMQPLAPKPALLKLVLTVLGVTFLGEVSVMLVLPSITAELAWLTTALVDALLLTSLLATALWVLIVRPTRRSASEGLAHLAALVHNAPEIVFTVNAAGRLLSLNPAGERLFSTTESAVRGECLHVLGLEGLPFKCGCRGEPPCSDWRPSACGQPIRLRRKSSEGRPLALDCSLTSHCLGGSPAFTLTLRNVTAEVEAQRQTRLQAAALDAAANGIFITDSDGRIEWANSSFRAMTGYGEDVLGKTPRVLKSGKHDRAFYEAMWKTILDGRIWAGEVVNRRRDGTLFTCANTITPVRLDDEGTTQFVAVAQDVTQRRELERRLKLSERMASIGTLAAGVAHEINNPLAFIKSNLGFVREHLAHDPSEGAAEAIRALDEASIGAERVQKIVLGLKTFSRADDEAHAAVDVRVPLQHALAIARNTLHRRANIVIDLALTPAVGGNEGRLSQVFLNLLINAAQAIPEGHPSENEVRVATSTTPEGKVLVEISDTGCGISAAVKARLFNPFFTTKPVGVGTGLGLYICHNLLSAMGGEISVDSELGHGSRFRVLLPPSRPSSTDTYSESKQAPGATRSTSHSSEAPCL